MIEDRDTSRRFFLDVWKKFKAESPLEPLETIVANVIVQHPEYHTLLNNEQAALEASFDADGGESNPFLHMGLHISIQEQWLADRPVGIKALYRSGLDRFGDPHLLDHRVMECLGRVLWQAQRDQTMPDDAVYLACVRKIVS